MPPSNRSGSPSATIICAARHGSAPVLPADVLIETFIDFAQLLELNRGSPTVFDHASGADELSGHSHKLNWFGQVEPLDLSTFE